MQIAGEWMENILVPEEKQKSTVSLWVEDASEALLHVDELGFMHP